ncbi:hypothetical protein [Enteroccous phage Ef212]|nr:hypothetical protein [Enteroccous phage Ef212]
MVALLLSIVVATPSIIFYLFKPLGGSELQPKPTNILPHALHIAKRCYRFL